MVDIICNTFSGQLFNSKSSKNITIQKPPRSNYQEWSEFVREYICTIQQNWQNPQDATKWHAEVSKNVDLFDRLFLHLWFSAIQSGKPRFWKIKASRQTVNTRKYTLQVCIFLCILVLKQVVPEVYIYMVDIICNTFIKVNK